MSNLSREFIDTAFQRLILGGRQKFGSEFLIDDYLFALKRAESVLLTGEQLLDSQIFELRLRLALHLSPVEAIKYDPENSRPRYKLIQDYLEEAFDRKSNETELLARELAILLDDLDEERDRSTTAHLSELLTQHGNKCAHCHVHFNSSPISIMSEDRYKPYYESTEKLYKAEVDHIEAVSTFGTNGLDNLQVLCKICNVGKGQGLGMDIMKEKVNAAKTIDEVERHYKFIMLYYVIERDQRKCTKCGSSNKELTIRPSREKGGYIRSNLTTVCYDCI